MTVRITVSRVALIIAALVICYWLLWSLYSVISGDFWDMDKGVDDLAMFGVFVLLVIALIWIGQCITRFVKWGSARGWNWDPGFTITLKSKRKDDPPLPIATARRNSEL